MRGALISMRAAPPSFAQLCLEGWGIVGVVPRALGPIKLRKVQAIMQTWVCFLSVSASHKSGRIILHAKHIKPMQAKSRKFLPHATHFGLFGN